MRRRRRWDTQTDDRAALRRELVSYCLDATEATAEQVLTTVERGHPAIQPGKLVPLVRVLAAATGLPRAAIVMALYHCVALAQTREGAEVILGLAVQAAQAHRVLQPLVDMLKAHVVPSRPPGERSH